MGAGKKIISIDTRSRLLFAENVKYSPLKVENTIQEIAALYTLLNKKKIPSLPMTGFRVTIAPCAAHRVASGVSLSVFASYVILYGGYSKVSKSYEVCSRLNGRAAQQ